MVTIRGRAKINLTLDVLGLRDDGYHEIATVMQSLALADTLTLTREESEIALTVDMPGLETDERNLAWRAAALVRERGGIRGRLDGASASAHPLAQRQSERLPWEAEVAFLPLRGATTPWFLSGRQSQVL